MILPIELKKIIIDYISIKSCKICQKKINILKLNKKFITNNNKFIFCSKECYFSA